MDPRTQWTKRLKFWSWSYAKMKGAKLSRWESCSMVWKPMPPRRCSKRSKNFLRDKDFFFFFLNFWVYVLGFGFEPNFRDEKVAPWFENWWNRCHLADAPSKAETFSTTKFFFFFLNFWVYVLGFGFVFLFKTLRFQFTLFLVFNYVFNFFI